MKIEKATCPNCKSPIGDIFVIDGKSFMFDGAWLIRQGTHNCSVCSERYFWHGEHFDRQYQGDNGGSVVQ